MAMNQGIMIPTDKDYLLKVKERGYFISVDSKAENIVLVPGGKINDILAGNNNMLFIFGVQDIKMDPIKLDLISKLNIAGVMQDIIDALEMLGYGMDEIVEIMCSGITIDNVMAAQEWITIFHNQNIGERAVTKTIGQVVMKPHPEENPNLSYPVNTKYTLNYIAYLRQIIHDGVNRNYLNNSPNFETIPNILEKLFGFYDNIFFGSKLSEIMMKDNIQLNFEYSPLMTKTAGRCKTNGCHYEIKLSLNIILGTFRNNEKSYMSNGLHCYDRLGCLMNVFEHELIHFVVGITHGHIKKNPIYKSHGSYFEQLVMSYFGHTEFKHSLLNNMETLGKIENFREGNYVTYKSKKGEIVTGKIDKLNPKRAVIGNMCVPYSLLRLATPEEISNMPVENIDANKNIHTFSIGDIVSYTDKGSITTDRIIRVNPKTCTIGIYKIPKSWIRPATQYEQKRFISSPSVQVKTRTDFYVGQNVQFRDSKTGKIITGPITKLNPVRAIINKYSVPYPMITEA